MTAARLTVALLAVLSLAPAGSRARARRAQGSPRGRKGLRAFLLRADEPTTDVYPRTPSFAWKPVRGDAALRVPALDEQPLPRQRHRLQRPPGEGAGDRRPDARCRGSPASRTRSTPACAPSRRPARRRGADEFGFNMRWPDAARADELGPGLLRWTPVAGATSTRSGSRTCRRWISTSTNVADQREYYSFHPDAKWTGSLRMARPRRSACSAAPARTGCRPSRTGRGAPSSRPSTPPSPPARSNGCRHRLRQGHRRVGGPDAHSLMPAFTYGRPRCFGEHPAELYRVYVSTDRTASTPSSAARPSAGPRSRPAPPGCTRCRRTSGARSRPRPTVPARG